MALEEAHWTMIKARALPCLLRRKDVELRANVDAKLADVKSSAATVRSARDAFETNEDPKKHEALQAAYNEAAIAANAAKAAHDQARAELLHLNTPEGQLDLFGENWELLSDSAGLEAWCEAEEIKIEEEAIAIEEAGIAKRKADLTARKG